MNAALSRVIFDMYHLRRVHVAMPDQTLARILKGKLSRLNLKPALAAFDASLPSSSPSSSVAISSQSWSCTSSGSLNSGALPVAANQFLPAPSAVSQLLECLAYFELGKSAIATDAVLLAQHSLPYMNSRELCATLAACCALGQQEASLSVLPLLIHVLRGSDSSSFSVPMRRRNGGTAHLMGTSALAFNETNSGTVMSGGEDMVMLMEALQRVGVHQEEVWSTLAEHCVRTMDNFSASQLLRVIEILHAERVTYYSDFFAAAESFIVSHSGSSETAATSTFGSSLSSSSFTTATSAFMTPAQLNLVIEYYKSLGQPVMSLMAMSAGRLSDSFDSGLEAAASAPSSSMTHRYTARIDSGSGETVGDYCTVNKSDQQESPALLAFAETAVRTLASADGHELLELLTKCMKRGVMHVTIMNAATERLVEVYFPGEGGKGSTVVTQQTAHTRFRNASADLAHMIHTIFTMLHAGDRKYFADSAGVIITAVLDAVAAEAVRSFNSRLLVIAKEAHNVLPTDIQPEVFYRAITTHLRQSNDISTNESSERLMQLTTSMMALQAYGGREVLAQYMPAITIAAANTSRRTQVELVACLAGLPCAKAQLLPSIFRALTNKTRGWEKHLTPEEVRLLLEAMQRSGLRDSQLIGGVVSYVQGNLAAFEASHLTEHLFSLAVLGYRNIDLFTAAAVHLLEGTSSITRGHASVHDLSLLLYVFTFVIKGVIRVVQQILARLRIAGGQASARDITLVLYSMVKLQIGRHSEVTAPLCDRACLVLGDFTAQEMTSTWTSLRALSCYHEDFLLATKDTIVAQSAPRTVHRPASDAKAVAIALTDDQYVCVVSAMLQVVRSVQAVRRTSRGTLLGVDSAAAYSSPGPLTGSSAHVLNDDAVLQETFKLCALRLAGAAAVASSVVSTSAYEPKAAPSPSVRPAVAGLQLYRSITTLARVQLRTPLCDGEWALLAVGADAFAAHLTEGSVRNASDTGISDGCAAAEVLVALHDLHTACIPTLPQHKAKYIAWTTVVEGWGQQQGNKEEGGEQQRALTPHLEDYVRACINTVVAVPELKAELKRTGLFSSLSAAPAPDDMFDNTIASGGLTRASSWSDRIGAAVNKKPRRPRLPSLPLFSSAALTERGYSAAADTVTRSATDVVSSFSFETAIEELNTAIDSTAEDAASVDERITEGARSVQAAAKKSSVMKTASKSIKAKRISKASRSGAKL